MSFFRKEIKKEEPMEPQWRIPEWFPKLSKTELEKLKGYHSELIKFNKTLNLISNSTLIAADSIHFADSILVSEIITKNNKLDHIYDIGSGNGLPGMVIAILNPSIKITLVEQDLRKAEFLKLSISALGLLNINVYPKAVETLPEKTLRFGVARGFASLPKSLLITRKLFKKGGLFFHVKSEEWPNEVAQMPSQLCSFWYPALLAEYKIPTIESKFAVVRVEKISD